MSLKSTSDLSEEFVDSHHLSQFPENISLHNSLEKKMLNESTIEENVEVQDFTSILKQQLEEFKDLQQRVIALFEDGLDEHTREKLAPEASILPGFSHGEAPFMIVVDDGDPLLLLDENYKCHPLPPHFEMDDECVSDDYNAIYSTPMMMIGESFSFSIIRFFPANPEYKFPLFDPNNEEEIDKEFFDLCDQAYNEYLNEVQFISKEKLDQYFNENQESHQKKIDNFLDSLDEAGLDRDALKPVLFRAMMTRAFSTQTSAASEKLLESIQNRMEEDD